MHQCVCAMASNDHWPTVSMAEKERMGDREIEKKKWEVKKFEFEFEFFMFLLILIAKWLEIMYK